MIFEMIFMGDNCCFSVNVPAALNGFERALTRKPEVCRHRQAA
jgi:hypothetical protein